MPDDSDDIQDGQDPIPNSAGAGARTIRDALIRDPYLEAIGEQSAEAVQDIEAARNAGDLTKGEARMKRAFETRNRLRAETQRKLSTGGRAFSEAVEVKRSLPDVERKARSRVKLLEELGRTGNEALGRTPPKVSAKDHRFNVAREVAESSGRSNKALKPLQHVSKGLGGLALAYGLWRGVRNVLNAKEGRRLATLGWEAFTAAVGWVASSLGSALGASAGRALGIRSAVWLFGLGLGGTFVAGLLLTVVFAYALSSSGENEVAGLGPLPNCQCAQIDFGLLTADFREECMKQEQELLELVPPEATAHEVAHALELDAGGDGLITSGMVCESVTMGPGAWPAIGGPIEKPAGMPNGRGLGGEPCDPEGLTRECRR